MTNFVERGHHFSVEKQDLKRAQEIYQLVEESDEARLASDPVEAAFLTTFRRELLLPGGLMRPHLEHILAMNRQRGIFSPNGQVLRRIEFSIDKQMRKMYPPNVYPHVADTPAFWRNGFRKLDQDELFEDSFIKLQSNMADASAINDLITKRLRGRWTGDVTALNNGISLGIPDKKWMLDGFKPVRVVKAPRYNQPIVPGGMEPDEEMQAVIDDLASQAPAVSRIVGYDIVPVHARDEEAIARLFSDTFPFTESVRRPDEVAEFMRLAYTETDKVVPVRGIVNALDEHSLTRLAEPKYLGDGKAQALIYSAFLFEQRNEDVVTIAANTAEYASDDSIGIASDFFDEKFRFIRGRWWHRPGSWATAVFNPKDLDMMPIRLCTFSTRRGTEMWLTEEGRRFFRDGELPF